MATLTITMSRKTAVGLGLGFVGIVLIAMAIYLGRQLLRAIAPQQQSLLPAYYRATVRRMMNLAGIATFLFVAGLLQWETNKDTVVGIVVIFFGLMLVVAAVFLGRQLAPAKAELQPPPGPANSPNILKRMITRLLGAIVLVLAGFVLLGVNSVR